MNCKKLRLHDVVGPVNLASPEGERLETILKNSPALQNKMRKIYMVMGQGHVAENIFQAADTLFLRDYAIIKSDHFEAIFVPETFKTSFPEIPEPKDYEAIISSIVSRSNDLN